MSDEDNRNPENDKFFAPLPDRDRPKPPGPFTQAFVGGPAASPEVEIPDPPKDPSTFTSQFGDVSAAPPFTESPKGASNPEVAPRDIFAKSPFAGALTRMFGSEPEAPFDVVRGEATNVMDSNLGGFQSPGGKTETLRTEVRQSSGFTELFGSPEPSKSPGVDPARTPSAQFFGLNQPSAIQFPNASQEKGSAGFTELFNSGKPGPALPTSPPGEFTRMMSEAPPVVPPDREETPDANFFAGLNDRPASRVQNLPGSQSEVKPGGFTQLFGGESSAPGTPVQSKPHGEFTRMISGNDPAPQASSPATPSLPMGMSSAPGHSAATRLFGGPETAGAVRLPDGPSEYTRVISARQLRDLQPGVAGSTAGGTIPSAGNPPVSAIGSPPNAPMVGNPPAMQTPQPGSLPAPYGVPQWQPPPPQQVQPPQFAWQPPPAPPIAVAVPAPNEQSHPRQGQSKLMKYLPLVIVLNVLFLFAVLLIVLFALKR